MDWKRNWIQLASLALSVVLLVVVVVRQSAQIEELYDRFADSQHYLESRIADIDRSVSYAAQEETKLVKGYSIRVAGIDRNAKSILLNVSVTLGTYGTETKAALVLTQGEKVQEVPMQQAPAAVFMADAPLSVIGDTEVALALVVDNSGVVTREEITDYGSAMDLLPICIGDTQSGVVTWEETAFWMDSVRTVQFSDEAGNPATVQSAEFRLYQNAKLVQTMPASPQEDGTYAAGTWDSVPSKYSDGFRLTVACIDQYGLGYEFTLETWANPQGGGAESWEAPATYPTITWPT